MMGGGKDNAALSMVLFLNLIPAILIFVILAMCLPSLLLPQIKKFKPPNMYVGVNTILTLLQTFFITILNFSITLVLTRYDHPNADYSSLVVYPYLLTDDDEVGRMTTTAAMALSVWCAGTLFVFAACIALRSLKP